MLAGIFLVIIGAVFLLQNLGYISGSAWKIIWPLILIALGLSILFRRRHFWWCYPPDWWKKEKKNDDN
ncbi:MAG: DUF5668 domain-containing protein [Acidobacteriota bacterium]